MVKWLRDSTSKSRNLLASFLRAHHCLRRPSGGPAGGECRSSAHPGACSAPRASAEKDRGTFFGLRRTAPCGRKSSSSLKRRPVRMIMRMIPRCALGAKDGASGMWHIGRNIQYIEHHTSTPHSRVDLTHAKRKRPASWPACFACSISPARLSTRLPS